MFLIIVFWYAVLSLSDSCILSLFLPTSDTYTAERKLPGKEDFLNVYFDECGKNVLAENLENGMTKLSRCGYDDLTMLVSH